MCTAATPLTRVSLIGRHLREQPTTRRSSGVERFMLAGLLGCGGGSPGFLHLEAGCLQRDTWLTRTCSRSACAPSGLALGVRCPCCGCCANDGGVGS